MFFCTKHDFIPHGWCTKRQPESHFIDATDIFIGSYQLYMGNYMITIYMCIYIYMCVLSIFSVFLCLWLIWRSLRSWSCFACFLWLLFSWFIGCLVSSVCKLFGRLAACLFHMPTPTFMKTYRSPGSFFWFRYLDQTNAKLKQMPIKITNNAQTVHMFSFYFGGSLQTL